MEPFEYPPLPPGKDGIRILNIEPGDFYDDPIVCTLTSVAFTSKPRYLALSYTWDDAFPHDRSLPTNKSMVPVPSSCRNYMAWDGQVHVHRDYFLSNQAALEVICKELKGNKAEPITINGQPFAIHHNLHLSLLHLRSKKTPLPLWVDAVCINQANADERNAQVALMSFIYPRAQAVVAWLGVGEGKPAGKAEDLFKEMAAASVGSAPGFLQTLAEGGIIKHRPINTTIANASGKSSYWTRLWILQEACLASQLVFLCGSRFWTFEQLSDWQSEESEDLRHEHSAAMIRMLDARRARHTDAMKLENLAEQFRGLACSELKDRIYGLVGLANDIRPFFTNDRFKDPVEEHIASLDMEAVPIPIMQRGMGRLRVDYSTSFYDIWRDVLKNIYFRVGPLVHEFKDNAWTADFRYQERRISVVRSAGVMQEILSREVGKEFYGSLPPKASTDSFVDQNKHNTNTTKVAPEKPCVRALGYIAAKILKVGPSYTELISSANATYDWVDCWEDSYEMHQLAELREVNETYLRRITRYTDEDLAYIRPIKSYGTMARPVRVGTNGGVDLDVYTAAFEVLWSDEPSIQDTNPHICLSSGHLIALVPAMTRVGDIIVRFWDCSTAAVMRPVDNFGLEGWTSDLAGWTSDLTPYFLIGKADISQPRGPWEEPVLYRGRVMGLPPPAGTPYTSNVLDVDLDFRSLQMLSAPMGPGR